MERIKVQLIVKSESDFKSDQIWTMMLESTLYLLGAIRFVRPNCQCLEQLLRSLNKQEWLRPDSTTVNVQVINLF